MGRDAQKQWSKLIKIVKAESIEEGKKAAAERKLKEGNLLSRAEMLNLEKSELDELFDDLDREETEKKENTLGTKKLQAKQLEQKISET